MLDNLLKRVENGVISHAYCLVGSVDKTLATFLDIVGILKIDKQEIWIAQEEKILIEHIRGLEKWVNQKPLNGERKLVYLPLDGINHIVLNALLKTIEEPPGYVTIILSVNNIQNVLPTIKSRCQVVWVGSSDIKAIPVSKLDVTFFANITNLLKERSANDIIDEWLINLRSDIRLGKNIAWAKELLRLKKYTKTNVGDKLLLENAFLAGLENK